MPRHPRVMGPGQGILPLSPSAATGSAAFGSIGTGARGVGPSPDPSVGPFQQTATDFTNLFQYGTTAPHWSQNQMRQMYNIPLGSAVFNKRQTRNAITSAEIDRMYRNVTGGMGHYAGQMLPGIFGGGLGPTFGGAPGGAPGGQYSVQPPRSQPLPPGPGGDDFDEDDIDLPLEDLLPGLGRPASGWPPDPVDTTPWWQQQIQMPYSPKFPPNQVPIDPRAVHGIPGNPHRRDLWMEQFRQKLKHRLFPKSKPTPIPERPSELF